MKNEIQTILGRPKRYNNIDGSCDIIFGVMVLGFAILGYLQMALPDKSVWRLGASGMLLFVVVLVPMFALIFWIPKIIKRRVTWPRTGYVVLHGEGEIPTGSVGKRWWATMAGVAVTAAVIAAGLSVLERADKGHDWISLMWLGNVLIFVAGYGYWTYFLERGRLWKWVVLLCMVLGVLVIAFFAPGHIVELRWYMLFFVGLAWLGSGVASLILYIRYNHLPAPETE